MNLRSFLRLPLFAFLFMSGICAWAQTPDHYVYLSFLPKASELRQDAKTNGLTILSLSEQPDRVIVSYQYPDGHTATLGYALRGSSPAPITAARPVTRVVATPPPEVIYVERPYETRVVYTDPWYNAWAPLTIGFGLGWSTGYYSRGPHYHGGGYYRGGYRGGYHGGYRGGGRGRW